MSRRHIAVFTFKVHYSIVYKEYLIFFSIKGIYTIRSLLGLKVENQSHVIFVFSHH